MLIRIAPAAEGKLVAAAPALLRDPPEVFDGHIRLFNQKTALVAADARLRAQTGLAVYAVPHHAHVDKMRERRHEWVHARVMPVFIQHTRADVRAGLGVERRSETILFVVNNVSHFYPFRLLTV